MSEKAESNPKKEEEENYLLLKVNLKNVSSFDISVRAFYR